MNRLHPENLGQLAADVQLPPYRREELRPGILHLGLGAFHRAHQAVFTEDAIAASGGDWGIIGVSMRSNRVARQLRPQQNLYSLMSEDARGYQLQVLGAITETLVASRELERVLEAFANPAIQVVTLTITEKGYCLAADGHSLDAQTPVVSADLARPSQPSSAVGILALGLKHRLEAGGAPLTLVSCDNLSANGRVLEGVLKDYLQLTFPGVLPWLDSSLAFPCSVVDRIVPAISEEKRQEQCQRLGLIDQGAVSTEPFTQWIIEDHFAAARPDWQRAGVQLVGDILPYEKMKLGLLNASHSAIAYLGLLAGLETVDQVMANERLGPYIQRLMSLELTQALEVPVDFDLDDYRDALLLRFSNPSLGHRCQQIAMDGTEKIRQRWLPILQQMRLPEQLLKALGAWCHIILQTDVAIEDPRQSLLLELRSSGDSLDGRLDGALDNLGITPRTIPDYAGVKEILLQNLDILDQKGVSQLLN